MNDKHIGLKPGKIILICKPFRSHDGYLLIERFMCVLKIENDNILLLPMSTFHSESEKTKKLSYKNVFEYSKIHGNTLDGYVKCNQMYTLSMNDFDNREEIIMKHQMDDKHLEKLKNKIEYLWKNKIKFLEKKIIFEDSFELSQKDQADKVDFDNLLMLQKINQKHIAKIKKYEKKLKEANKIGNYESEDEAETDDEYER